MYPEEKYWLITLSVVVGSVITIVALVVVFAEVSQQCYEYSLKSDDFHGKYDACLGANWVVIDWPDPRDFIHIKEPSD